MIIKNITGKLYCLPHHQFLIAGPNKQKTQI